MPKGKGIDPDAMCLQTTLRETLDLVPVPQRSLHDGDRGESAGVLLPSFIMCLRFMHDISFEK